jgi:membrane protease YdiL (CAAX protease family)
MGEELGWRGFMLPRLMEKYTIFRSTVLVGLAWGLWHLASFTFPGAAIPSFLPVNLWTIGLYFINTIGLSFIFTYVYLKTDGSVLYAIVLHAFFNASGNVVVDLIGETSELPPQLLAYILNFLIAFIVGYLLIRQERRRTQLTG